MEFFTKCQHLLIYYIFSVAEWKSPFIFYQLVNIHNNLNSKLIQKHNSEIEKTENTENRTMKIVVISRYMFNIIKDYSRKDYIFAGTETQSY